MVLCNFIGSCLICLCKLKQYARTDNSFSSVCVCATRNSLVYLNFKWIQFCNNAVFTIHSAKHLEQQFLFILQISGAQNDLFFLDKGRRMLHLRVLCLFDDAKGFCSHQYVMIYSRVAAELSCLSFCSSASPPLHVILCVCFYGNVLLYHHHSECSFFSISFEDGPVDRYLKELSNLTL